VFWRVFVRASLRFCVSTRHDGLCLFCASVRVCVFAYWRVFGVNMDKRLFVSYHLTNRRFAERAHIPRLIHELRILPTHIE